MVGFVQHQKAVVQLGQQPRAQGGQQQIVVGHDDLGGHQVLAALVVDAVAEGRAVLARAGRGFCRHGAPGLGLGRGFQRVAVAVPGLAGQRVGHAFVELHARLQLQGRACHAALGLGLFLGEQIVQILVLGLASAGQPLQLQFADKAAPALGQRELERLLQLLGQRGQILVHQLFLQRHGGRGNQHPGAARQRHRNGGNAVRQRFAHPRSGLHHGNGPGGLRRALIDFSQLGLAQGLRDLGRHFSLPLTISEPRDGSDHVIEGFQGLVSPFFFMHFGVFRPDGSLWSVCL